MADMLVIAGGLAPVADCSADVQSVRTELQRPEPMPVPRRRTRSANLASDDPGYFGGRVVLAGTEGDQTVPETPMRCCPGRSCRVIPCELLDGVWGPSPATQEVGRLARV